MHMAAPLCLSLMFVTPALAWEHTMEWRFQGSEILSFSVAVPEFDEDPEVLEVTLSSPQHGQTQVAIEADLGVGDCVETLRYAQGDAFVTVVLTANLNAQTLNGVTLAQCSTR